MCMCRRNVLFLTLILAAWAPGLSASDSNAPPIECEVHPGYHLCRAQGGDSENLEYEWSVTGDLALNLASGPMASVRCRDGQSGSLVLRTRERDRQTSLCVDIVCGEEGTTGCGGGP